MTNLRTFKYGVMRVIPSDLVVSTSITLYGEWAEHEIREAYNFIPTGATVLDVGAFIGTHTLAFAAKVGESGKVLAFEPRPEVFDYLNENINLNSLQDIVKVFNKGIGSESREIKVSKLNLDNSSNFGGLSLIDESNRNSDDVIVKIDSIDSLVLEHVDFIKIDVEGMEVDVIRGAADTIERCRPIIFAECNTYESGLELFKLAASLNYSVHGLLSPAFNFENYNEQRYDMFGGAKEVTLILTPSENKKNRLYARYFLIEKPHDLREVLFKKPQYIKENYLDYTESLPVSYGDAALTARQEHVHKEILMHRSGKEKAIPEALHIVIPFYKQVHLVKRVFDSFKNIEDELVALNAKVYLYNDSPDFPGLDEEIQNCCFANPNIFLRQIRNDANLGFVKTINKAFAAANEDNSDVVIFNSDALVFPGSLTEVKGVAYGDPMIGFVCPRSNNATIATLPHSIDPSLSPEASYREFLELTPFLQRVTYVPTVVGFCLFIKSKIIKEFPAFDEVYGFGYNEENDYISRANRCGYRAALANHAFVWHEGEQSFSVSSAPRAEREEINAKLLNGRYAEYPELIKRYFSSAEYKAEQLVCSFASRIHKKDIAFDFSTFGLYHNGTFEAGIKLLKAVSVKYRERYNLYVYMDKEAWDFHELKNLENIKRLDTHDPEANVFAIVRMGQPFDANTLTRLYSRAPIVLIFMLDTIAYDCGYISLSFDRRIWDFALKYTDVIMTNSRFTLDRFSQRFNLGDKVIRDVSYHSVKIDDYKPNIVVGSKKSRHIFVIGNHYDHKYVIPTAERIASEFPSEKIVAVGYDKYLPSRENITGHNSGTLSDEDFESLYIDSSVVVFPSHYEGFGFPIFHALAREKPVFIRDSDLNRELIAIHGSNENIYLYSNTEEMIGILRKEIPRWVSSDYHSSSYDWGSSATDVIEAIEKAKNTFGFDFLVERLRWAEYVFSGGNASIVTYRSPGVKVGNFLAGKIDCAIQRPIIRRILLALLKRYRSFKTK